MKINVTHFGFEGEGATVREAKLDAARKVTAALEGYWTPTYILWRGQRAFVWREPQSGWVYRLIHDDTETGHTHGSTCGADNDEKSAVLSAKRHMATLDTDAPEEDVYTFLGGDRSAMNIWRELRSFHRAYRKATEDGLKDTAAHEWACYHKNEFAA